METGRVAVRSNIGKFLVEGVGNYLALLEGLHGTVEHKDVNFV